MSCFILCLYPQRQERKDFSTDLVDVSYSFSSALSSHTPLLLLSFRQLLRRCDSSTEFTKGNFRGSCDASAAHLLSAPVRADVRSFWFHSSVHISPDSHNLCCLPLWLQIFNMGNSKMKQPRLILLVIINTILCFKVFKIKEIATSLLIIYFFNQWDFKLQVINKSNSIVTYTRIQSLPLNWTVTWHQAN